MEISHIQKYIHTTPRKLRLVAAMIRKMEPDRALDTLRFTKKYAAKDLEEAIKVALANAKTANINNIVFKSVEINEGPKMRRFMAGTRGRVKPFKRRMAHIKIVLTDKLESRVKSQESSKKVDKKEEAKK